MKKIKFQKLSTLNITFGLSGILFIFYLLASLFVFPSTDDYAYAVRTFNTNIVTLQIHYYLSFCGRYFATMVTHIFTGLPKFYSFSFVSPFLVVLSVFLSALFIFKVSASRLPNAKKTLPVFLALFFTITYFISLPDPAQSLYWITGSHVYMLPMILLFAALGLLLLPKKSILIEILIHLALVLAFFSFSGCSEITAFLGTSIILLTLLLFHKNFRTFWYGRLISAFIAVTLGFFLIMAAPGNSVRMEYAGDIAPASFPAAFVSAVKALSIFLIKQNFFYPPILLFLTLFIVFFFLNEFTKKNIVAPKYTKNIWATLLPLGLVFFILFASPFLTAWGGYAEPPLRMYSIPLGLSWPLLALFGFDLAGYLSQNKTKIKDPETILKKTSVILIIIFVFVLAKFLVNIPKYPSYAETMRTRYNLLEQLENKSDLTIYVRSPVRPWPVYNEDVLSLDQLKELPSHRWKNETAAKYFGTKMIYAQSDNYYNFWDQQSTNDLKLLYLITFLANSGLFVIYFILIFKRRR